MKISIRNYSNKKRSHEAKKELKLYALEVASELNISEHIQDIRLEYRKEYRGYYGKKSPFQGFELLWNKGQVKIIFAAYYDRSQEMRKDFIVHELTHVRQLISGDLRPMGERIKWKGRFNHTWKKFRFKVMESFKNEADVETYLRKHFPWEIEVQKNCERFEIKRCRAQKAKINKS